MPKQARDIALAPIEIDSLAKATEAIGSEAFYPALQGFCQQICAADSLVLIAFGRQHQPELLWEFTRPGLIDKGASMENYLAGAYLLDPYYQAWLEGQPSGLYHLRDIAPDDFGHSEYYRQYYQYANFNDELGLLWQRPDGHCVHISLASAAGFSLAQQQRLQALSPILLALAAQQWQQTSQLEQNPMHQQLQRAFAEFGSSLLTQREGEIARLLLHGHSSKSMAARLGISQETIKGHKRNLYQKLDISSQAELFSLFLGALSLVTSDSLG
ncbi:MAG: LuxR C-terminal-related transcriptional regulator, partial [Cellvibrionaceae bacterium]|nr:LuxR C-terminal-related transcriptional regulator [Cellvibrionaceae bacterium]